MGQIFLWWLLVELLGLVGLPLAAAVFANLPDRGWALAKPLSLLLVGWLVWFPLAVLAALPFSQGWIVGTILAFALVNLRLWRTARVREGLRDLWAHARGYALGAEAVFAAAFGGMAWERSFTPAVVDTEKFMDVAFLSAIWRAPHLPPPDPWLSGQPINYYYFGHYLVALVAKTLGTPPAVAFNIGIALIFALTAVAVFGVAADLFAAARPPDRRRAPGDEPAGSPADAVPAADPRIWPRSGAFALKRAWVAGLAACCFVLIFGNLDSVGWWWQAATAAASGSHPALATPLAWWWHRALWPTYNWWCPSRAFATDPSCGNSPAITEFPAFSFVLADLHAHVLSLPFATLAVGIALSLLLGRGQGLAAFGGRTGARMPGQPGGGDDRWLTLPVIAVALGALYAINGWDLPTYLGLALLALAIQQWLAHGRRVDRRALGDFALAGGALVVLAVVAYLPFSQHFVSPSQGIGVVPAAARSPIAVEVAIFGIPAFVVLSFVLSRLAHWLGTLVAAAGALCLLLLTRATAAFPGWTLLWSSAIVAACAALGLGALGAWPAAARHRRRAEDGTDVNRDGADARPETPAEATGADASHAHGRAEVFVYCLAGTAAALVAACEVVYLRDVFSGGSLFRMNTVFKLYYQAWLLAGLAAGPCAVWLAARAVRVLKAMLPILFSAGEKGEPEALLPVRADAEEEALAAHLVRGAPQHPPAPGSGPAAFADGETSARERALRPAEAGAGEEDQTPWLAALRWLGAGGIVVWMAALTALLAAGLVYPVLAASGRTANFTLPRSLDGTAFMASDPVNEGDAPAIAWLNAHVAGDPVIVEAASYDEYTHLGRISAFTGLPTLLGWGGHEVQWRVNWLAQPGRANVINERLAAVDAIYTSADPHTVLRVMREYSVELVYVGAAERAQYPTADLTRFKAFLRVVYARDGVTVYALPSFKGVS